MQHSVVNPNIISHFTYSETTRVPDLHMMAMHFSVQLQVEHGVSLYTCHTVKMLYSSLQKTVLWQP